MKPIAVAGSAGACALALGAVPASADSGGMGYVPSPVVKKVVCVSKCGDGKRIQDGKNAKAFAWDDLSE